MAKRRKRKKKRYHTGVYVSTKTGQHCKYRSGWELVFMEHLDRQADVLTYGYEALKIPYISNLRSGKVRNYLPDFFVTYVDGRKVVIEIKPKRRVTQAAIQKKLKAAEGWCLAHGATLEVITEVELSMMGLFKR